MSIERGNGLVKIRRGWWQGGAKFTNPADVIEVTTQNLARQDRWQVNGFVDVDAAAISGHEFISVALHMGGNTIEQNAAGFGAHDPPHRSLGYER